MSDGTSTRERPASAPATPAEPILRASGVRRTYGSGEAAVEAVRGVDLTLAAGEIVVLVGRSGSGKSTLLHLLSGLDAPTEGGIWLEGRPLAELGEEERADWRARHMGFVLQRDNLIPSLTIEENVAAPLIISGRKRGEALERARELLGQVGLAARRDRWPGQVSGGEAQRAAVARACSGRPRLIFADEPTGALDSASGAVVLDLFRSLVKESGAATFVVSHDAAVSEIADRVLRMKDGVLEGGGD